MMSIHHLIIACQKEKKKSQDVTLINDGLWSSGIYVIIKYDYAQLIIITCPRYLAFCIPKMQPWSKANLKQCIWIKVNMKLSNKFHVVYLLQKKNNIVYEKFG